MINVVIYGVDEYSKALKVLIDGLYNVYAQKNSHIESFGVIGFLDDTKASVWDKDGIDNTPIMGFAQLDMFCKKGLVSGIIVPGHCLDEGAIERLNPEIFQLQKLYVANENIFDKDDIKLEDAKDLLCEFYVKKCDGKREYVIKEEPLVTIYTQAYNSEPYIRQCMESVINQSYKNWEYFVCNHGSKDNTLAIMREYEAKDSRITVIDMPNSARGFYPDMIKEKGRGKYFAMLDSDDYWHEDNLSKLVTFSELNNLDMTVCAIDCFKDKENEFRMLRKCEKAYCYNIEDNKYYWSFMYAFLRTTWGKVIRMECLREADFSTYKINAQDFISDDTAFTLANYEKCKRVGSIPDVLLYYRITEGSVTAKYRPKMIDNNENIYYQQLKVLENIGDNTQKSREHAIAVFWRAMYDASVSLFKTDLGDEEKIHEIWKMCQLKASNELVSMRYTDCTETMRLCMSYVEYLKDKKDTLGNESIKKLQDINAYFDKFKSTRISNT